MTEFKPKRIGQIPMIDATKELRVRIEDIDRRAIQCSPSRCVGANAVNRRKGFSNARMGATKLYATVKGVPIRWELSTDTKAMCKAYDDDNQVMPAGIVLVFVPPRKKLGSRKGESGTNRRSGLNQNLNTKRAPHRHIFVEPPDDNG